MIQWDKYIAVIGKLQQRPHLWNQNYFKLKNGGCGCVAAHLAVYGRYGGSIQTLKDIGFNDSQARYIFDQRRKWEELYDLAVNQKFPDSVRDD